MDAPGKNHKFSMAQTQVLLLMISETHVRRTRLTIEMTVLGTLKRLAMTVEKPRDSARARGGSAGRRRGGRGRGGGRTHRQLEVVLDGCGQGTSQRRRAGRSEENARYPGMPCDEEEASQ